MTIELTAEDQLRLAELAGVLHVPEEAVALRALHEFLLAQDAAYLAALQEGDKDFERGDTMDHAEVVAQFQDVLRPL